RGTHDRLGGDVAAGSRTVVDDERLTEPLREPLTYQARRDVRTASGREANNDAHRPRRIGLRPSEPGDGRERGSAHRQMQKMSAGKFHFDPPFTVAVGTCVSSHAPRPDPYVRLSRIRLLPRVGNGTSRRIRSSAFDTRPWL